MTLNILGYTYQVDMSKTKLEIGAFGRCILSSLTIQVASDLMKEQQASTLLHEIIEAINMHLGVGLKEGEVMLIETGLYQVFEANGIHVASLLGKAPLFDMQKAVEQKLNG